MRLFYARSSVVMFAALAAAAAPAAAEPVINNTGILDPDRTITFSEFNFPRWLTITTQYESLGVTFSPAMYYDGYPFFFPTPSLINSRRIRHNPLSIKFTQTVEAAAFAFQSSPNFTRFTAKLGGIAVESFEAFTTGSILPDVSHASDFYGFQGILFDEIVIQRVDINAPYFQIDNLQFRVASQQFGVVPEPSSLTLMGAGLVGLALTAARASRRR